MATSINLDKSYIFENTFQIPYKNNKYILYNPINRFLALVTAQTINEIIDFLNSDRETANNKILQELDKKGLFKNPKKHDFDLNEKLIPYYAPFQPHEVTLDITWKCNLKCIYCYGNGGDTSIDIDWNCAKSAIDLCIENCEKDQNTVGLHFHGNGEPTQNWSMLTELTDYTKNQTRNKNLNLKTSIATNGVISKKQALWIAENIDRISFSFDGNAYYQNKQRPLRDSSTSAKYAIRTANLWKSLGKSFNFRITVTKLNENSIQSICDHLFGYYPKSFVAIEPMVLNGRARNISDLSADPVKFAKTYVRILKKYSSTEKRIFYSGFRGFSTRRYFCGASKPHFAVMANGSVTSCFSYSSHEPIRDLFVFGDWDKTKNKFIFNKKTIAQLRGLNIDNDTYCGRCIAKYHCIGDCPAIRKYDLLEDNSFYEKFDVDFLKNRRCTINRTILKEVLIDLVDPINKREEN